jgi:trypsin-like peptidase
MTGRRIARWPLLAISVILVTMVSACGGGGGAADRTAPSTPATTAAAAPAPPPTLSELIARERRSVVRISASTCDGESIGSGFIVGDRLVATVFHVVDGAESIRISTPGGSKGDGVVVGYDRDRDLALVRAGSDFPGDALTFSSTGTPVGSDVVALGYPLGLPLTATRGTVTGLHRHIDVEGVDHEDLLQTDAAVNPGNSGGPVIDTAGDVVAIVVAGGEGYQGIGFGIPRQRAQPLLEAWAGSPTPVDVSAPCAPEEEPVVTEAPEPTTEPQQVSLAEARVLVDESFRDITAGDYGTGLDLALTAIPVLEAAGDPLTGNAYYNAGRAYLLLGDCTSAVPYLEESSGLGTPQQNAIRSQDLQTAEACATP